MRAAVRQRPARFDSPAGLRRLGAGILLAIELRAAAAPRVLGKAYPGGKKPRRRRFE
jgi:hypothetical protein